MGAMIIFFKKIVNWLLKIDLKTFLLILFIGIFLFNECRRNKTDKTVETIKIDKKKYDVVKRKTDSIVVNFDFTTEKEGKDIYHDTTIYVPILKNVDTTEILKEYFAKNIYKDTLKLPDSIGYVAIIDTLKENKLLHRTWNSNVNKYTVKELVYIKEPPRNEIYVGLNSTFNKTQFINSLGGSFTVKTKNNKLLQLGVGLNTIPNGNNTFNLQPYIGGGIAWRIKR